MKIPLNFNILSFLRNEKLAFCHSITTQQVRFVHYKKKNHFLMKQTPVGSNPINQTSLYNSPYTNMKYIRNMPSINNRAIVNQNNLYTLPAQSTNKSNTKYYWIKLILKIVFLFLVGYFLRKVINDTFNINVFIQYANKISVGYYLFMSSLSVLTNELLSNPEGFNFGSAKLKIPSDYNDISEKRIKPRKIMANAMNNSTGNNNSGGSGGNNGGQSSSAGATGSSSNSVQAAAVGDIRVRRVNPMSLTQMCNPIWEEAVQVVQPLDPESFARVKRVLAEEKNAFLINHPNHKSRVLLRDLGYNFKGKSASGSVVAELFVLKKTDPYFTSVDGVTNVDKIICYTGKEPNTAVKLPGRKKI